LNSDKNNAATAFDDTYSQIKKLRNAVGEMKQTINKSVHLNREVMPKKMEQSNRQTNMLFFTFQKQLSSLDENYTTISKVL